MPLQSNIDKAELLRTFADNERLSTSQKRVLRTKVKIALKKTTFPSGVVNHWCVPMHRSVTKVDRENFLNILGHIEQSNEQDLGDVKWLFDAMVI
ncbi:hypothetical protein PS918_03137 [Pseudomonas fluorescens]|uniref:Uncharacterized protein n=1 Tax=Pseudomonas fluorescens TaxID=294 RepID=A0A5E7T2S4_PSEFL|nr:hypothetical protein [Pseudomonas fluorescens]VVP89973.1 hypothetical protein PS918_03137 [Pseudomonas fluorescens]